MVITPLIISPQLQINSVYRSMPEKFRSRLPGLLIYKPWRKNHRKIADDPLCKFATSTIFLDRFLVLYNIPPSSKESP